MSREEQFEKIRSEWANCDRCPLAKLRKNIVFGQGNLNASLVMIGEAPGEDEDKFGKPFIGRAGEQFNKILMAVGITREDIWVTNSCLCRPKSSTPGKNNRAPTAKEIRACQSRLIEEIDIIKPEIIVLAGNTPLYMATRKRGITKNRGWQDTTWIGSDFIVEKVYATLHPASLLYGSTEQIKNKRQWVWEDWQQIAGALRAKKKEGSCN